MLEMFGGHPVPSLYACLFSEMHATEMSFASGAARFGVVRLPINARGETVITIDGKNIVTRLSVSRLLAGGDWQKSVRGKVVALMYTGPRSPTMVFNGKPEKIHDLFAAQVAALQKRMEHK